MCLHTLECGGSALTDGPRHDHSLSSAAPHPCLITAACHADTPLARAQTCASNVPVVTISIRPPTLRRAARAAARRRPQWFWCAPRRLVVRKPAKCRGGIVQPVRPASADRAEGERSDRERETLRKTSRGGIIARGGGLFGARQRSTRCCWRDVRKPSNWFGGIVQPETPASRSEVVCRVGTRVPQDGWEEGEVVGGGTTTTTLSGEESGGE